MTRCCSHLVSCIYRSFVLGYEALSYSVENDGKWSGRQLLQANEDNTTEGPGDGGKLYVRNCTEPGRNDSCFQPPSHTVDFLTSRYPHWFRLYC